MTCLECEKELSYMYHRRSMDLFQAELCPYHRKRLERLLAKSHLPVEAVILYYGLRQEGIRPMLAWWDGKRTVDLAISRVRLNIEIDRGYESLSHQQAMQELEVSVGRETYRLEPPFFVVATQNPIEQEGTYPLPEAQLDRFMMMLKVEYPNAAEEAEIVQRTTSSGLSDVSKVLTPAQILSFQDLVIRVPVSEPVVDIAVQIVRATRPEEQTAPESIREYVTYGAGPRATQHLLHRVVAQCIEPQLLDLVELLGVRVGVGEGGIAVGGGGVPGSGFGANPLHQSPTPSGPTQFVDCAAPGRGHNPPCRVRWYTVAPPPIACHGKRFLDGVFGI